ncbi:MAG: hypothetical protein ACR2PT_03180 [Endozoicomonas sp.]
MEATLTKQLTAKKDIVQIVNRYPGSTCAELVNITAFDTEDTILSLIEAHGAGVIRRGPSRFCHQRKVNSDTWWPAE